MMEKIISLFPYWVGIALIHLYFRKKQKNLANEILLASFRTTIQLILLAFALQEIFKSNLLVVTLLVTLVMTLNSSGQIKFRSKQKVANLFWISLLSNSLAIWPIAFFLSFDSAQDSWTTPQRLLPLMGMLLGNTLSGVSIGLESFMLNLKEKRNEVLTLLALGATNDESTEKFFQRALRAGITPQINSMISMGIISIPGMMAGQLISQADAMNASILQVKMMLSICIGTLLSIYIALRFVRRSIFLSTGELCLK